MAALASDLLRHFRLLLWNRLTEFNEKWQEARSQRLLPSLCFLGRLEKQDCRPSLWLAETFSTSFLKPLNRIRQNLTKKFLFFSGRWEKQDGRPGFWLAEKFSTFPLKPLNGIQRNLTGSKVSTSSTKFVFLGLISKQKCSPWQIPQKGGTLYSGARYVALWVSCFPKKSARFARSSLQVKHFSSSCCWYIILEQLLYPSFPKNTYRYLCILCVSMYQSVSKWAVSTLIVT